MAQVSTTPHIGTTVTLTTQPLKIGSPDSEEYVKFTPKYIIVVGEIVFFWLLRAPCKVSEPYDREKSNPKRMKKNKKEEEKSR